MIFIRLTAWVRDFELRELILAESLNDFIAGYVSGIAGLIIGSPLDILKVRLQASSSASLRRADNFPKVILKRTY
jgi:Mitochondrial carrier protein